MKKLYLVSRNHMDPSWLRCFTDHFTMPGTGDIVRPYSDIEEMLILEYMDFAEEHGVKYHIEQSAVVKKFLERNPDQKERFTRLVKNGYIELAGGGECVIDCNLTQGESWARNHLYSRKYYKREFNYKPRYAITPDIFGLPSQLPQFFRSIGYDALIIFDRVMLQNKPFWQGLDGTKIVLDSNFLQPPQPSPRTADCVKLIPCSACHGEGCSVCGGTGIDPTYDMTRPDKVLERQSYYGNVSAEEFLENLASSGKDEFFAMIVTEETRVGKYLYGPLLEAAPKHDFEIHFQKFEDNHDRWCPGQVEMLRSGNIPEDMVDTRSEGNPIFCGCYTSRIEIKKANRELEDILISAEKLAVLARMHGGWDPNAVPRRDYPAKKLEALWSKMAFIQFHDCVTGTHCDASNNELRRIIREVRSGAYQIFRDAARECNRKISCRTPEGYSAVTYFNTDTAPKSFPRLTIHAPADTENLEILDGNGKPVSAFDPCVTQERVGVCVEITVASEVPPLGWKTFMWRTAPAVIPDTTSHNVIENEYFRITAEGAKIKSIFDKQNARQALCERAGEIAIGVDIGSAYGRYEPERDHMRLGAQEISTEIAPGYSRFILRGKYSDESRKIRNLSWIQYITLYDGDPLVRWHTDVDWDGEDTRIFAIFPLPFDPHEEIYCEVPFGTMKRGHIDSNELTGVIDEWPSLGFAGVSSGGYNIAVLKGGLPAARISGNELQISILRSVKSDDPTYAGTTDCGHHSYDWALTTWTGSFEDGCCPARAASYNSCGITEPLDSADETADNRSEGTYLPAAASFPRQLCLSALKWSEDGKGPVVRFWESTGSSPILRMPEGIMLQRCNTLEEPDGSDPVSSYTFRPFEIATFRLIEK